VIVGCSTCHCRIRLCSIMANSLADSGTMRFAPHQQFQHLPFHFAEFADL
jgi:hypothetical protein